MSDVSDDEVESSAGIMDDSFSDMDGLGRTTDDNAERNELSWDEV